MGEQALGGLAKDLAPYILLNILAQKSPSN